jgi:hypothetical protein
LHEFAACATVLAGCFVAEFALKTFIESGDVFFDFGGEVGVRSGTGSSRDDFDLALADTRAIGVPLA